MCFNSIIDLSAVDFIHPWSVIMVCLLLIERYKKPDKKLLLPKSKDVLSYLKRMHFCDILKELEYNEEFDFLNQINMPESQNLNVQEIQHCRTRDEVDAILGKFLKIFLNFGLSSDDAHRATALVGELGNNAFDHNSFVWPTNITGCFIAAQNYPELKKIEVVVGDPGVGFLESLRAAFPKLENNIEAIKTGLEGHTGRIGEPRGNGLLMIQSWTKEYFSGKVMIHSGDGLVIVNKNIESYKVNKILGTLAQFVIYYM